MSNENNGIPSLKNLKIRDLGDFCLQWPTIRSQISDEIIIKNVNSTEMSELVTWLFKLADKVSNRQNY